MNRAADFPFDTGMFFSTVRIEAFKDKIKSQGTGFLFCDTERFGEPKTFIVTNRHVVEGFDNGFVFFHRAVNDEPSYQAPVPGIAESWKNWHFHPDKNIDIAILPAENSILRFNSTDIGFTQTISSSLLLHDNEPHTLEDVVFVGYPKGLWDPVHALPIARRGMIASFLNLDYNGLPCFLIDASVFEGSSGSPVFLLTTEFVKTNEGFLPHQKCNFIGILSASLSTACQFLKINTAEEKPAEHIDIGIAFKARAIIETIDSWFAKNPTIS